MAKSSFTASRVIENGRYQHIDASDTCKTFNDTPRPLQQTIFDALQWLIKIKALAPIETTQSANAVAKA
ncbi:MAG: hypothetical protein KC445_10195 [Anaerolineales bacterium]|nr:hypothetical protein [Anaerolineales bacterium]